MIPEIGQLAVSITLAVALLQSTLPLWGAYRNNAAFIALARRSAHLQTAFLLIAMLALGNAMLTDDFSVLYVANNSNSELPALYKVAAIWGAHEGSLLLWVFVLSLWGTAVAMFSRSLPDRLVAQVLSVMGMIGIGFLLFILLTSNPFDRIFPAPLDGADLNPLLQDIALVAHPPMLYTGYVGFSVAFSFAIAAMLSGRLDQRWARWTRPWTTAAWMFLTVGIALGSWWAYYELGWGGWWFWDPVENASFMPWLMGTALIHSLAVTEKRGMFKSSTLLLAIGAFSLSLLGTFLVRSGVLVSVHAFATDPARGMFILIFLGVVTGAALSLYAWRASSLETEVGFRPFSRESFLLMNSILLVIATGLILLGTLAPLVMDALSLGKISVGAPWFEEVFLIPMIPLVMILALGMHSTWRSADVSAVARKLRWVALLAVIAGIGIPFVFYGGGGVLTVVGITAAIWTIGAALRDPLLRLRGQGPRLTLATMGMQIAHVGLGLTILGITVTSSYTVETDQPIAIGDSLEVAGYNITFAGLNGVQGPNYEGAQGVFSVSKGEEEFVLLPEKRVYRVQKSPMTEAGIDAGWRRDVFIALGEPLGDGSWSIRIQYKPLIRFIWFGALIMAFGGLLAVSDRRYRGNQQTGFDPLAEKAASA